MAHPLTRQHHRAQLALRASTLRDLLRLWPLFDIGDIDRTWPGFEDAAVLLIRSRGRLSAGLAAAYYRNLRRAQRVPGNPPAPRATPTEAQIRTSLQVVGPINALRQIRKGRRFREAADTAFVLVSGAVARHVLNHGRDVLMNSIQDDPRAVRWARITGSNPCSFCTMLADQGAVFKEDTVDFEAHDHCACSPEPEFF